MRYSHETIYLNKYYLKKRSQNKNEKLLHLDDFMFNKDDLRMIRKCNFIYYESKSIVVRLKFRGCIQKKKKFVKRIVNIRSSEF